MTKEKVQYNHLVVLASAEYLTEQLPNKWYKWSDKKLDKFVEEHVWQPFEYWPVDDVWFQILGMAKVMQNCIERYDEVLLSNTQYETREDVEDAA